MTKFRNLTASGGLALALAVTTAGQVPSPSPPVQLAEDVLRIKTDLIQTGVSVTNKKGEFVPGLRREDFELYVDGRLVAPRFFEAVRVGVGATQADPRKTSLMRSTTQLTDVSRTMVFVVDDLHMSAESLIRTRRVVQRFIENEMLPSDRVAIVASSGNVGFLQQFTSDKDVLLTACARLVFNQRSADEAGPPPMSEFDAQSIDRGDSDVIRLFISETIRYNPGLNRGQAFSIVQARARRVLNNSHAFTQSTLGAVESSAVQAGKFPGRKAMYYFSDGMLLDPGNTDTPDTLRKITSAAARANVVIYSFDAKGLDASLPGSGGVDSPVMTQLGLSMRAAESFERQDALAYFAHRTGGRFIRNTNDIKGNLSVVTEEAFQYYLLAWEPDDVPSNKFHKIEIKVPGRPDLKVSYQTGYLDRPQRTQAEGVTSKSGATSTVAEPAAMVDAVEVPSTSLPTYLVLNYLELGKEGSSLSATIGVDPTAVNFDQLGTDKVAELEFTVLLYNQDGKTETAFKTPLRVTSNSPDMVAGRLIIYEYRTLLKPGLYQMRVRSRDQRSGRTGATAAWLQIPNASKNPALSSLLLGEIRFAGKRTLLRNIDHRFDRDTSLHYLGFKYVPAARRLNKEKVEIKADVLQANRIFASRSGSLAAMEGDDDRRLSFSGEVSLDSLAAGRYELRVIVSAGKDKPLVRRAYFEVR